MLYNDDLALESIATLVALHALEEPPRQKWQESVSQGASDATHIISTEWKVDPIIDSIAECLRALKPVVDNLKQASSMHGFDSMASSMPLALGHCMRKTSFLHRLHLFMYIARSNNCMTDEQVKRLASHGCTMGAIMDYMCKAAHFFNVNLNA